MYSQAVSVLEAAGHVAVDGSHGVALALLAAGDGVVAEGVLRAGRAGILGSALHVLGANALAWTTAIFAVILCQTVL